MPESSSSFGTQLSYVDGAVSLSEVISAMTFALDITEGAVPGHSLRSCLLGMRIAEAMNIPEEMRTSLYYALQLKDTGCSSNAARVTQMVGGDDRAMKSQTKLTDWKKPFRTISHLWPHILPEKNFFLRAGRLIHMAMTRERNNREMIQLRCERGAEIVRKLEMGEMAAEAVRRIDEHWDGSGHPDGLKGRGIPLLARICSVAQNLDVFAVEYGAEASMAMLRQRSGTSFDPDLVRVADSLHTSGALWKDALESDGVERARLAVLNLDPGMRARLVPERVDRICEAFASVVDAKSPFTYRHSIGVAEVAVEIAQEMQLPSDRVQLVRRAALLHDIGKLYVSNTILDKEGDLTPTEWAVVLEHPRVTRSILERVSSFRELAALAAEHHEKMDGSGYPLGLTGEQMSLESRLIALADTFAALAEKRPYREAIAPERILAILAPSVPKKFDQTCFAALESVVARWAREKHMGPWTSRASGIRPVQREWPSSEVSPATT
jgi:putative nucleotidyltransferase with HDIG domain